jgi:chromosomal replication initiation ATPase DnaA
LAADETQFTILVQNHFALDWLSHWLASVTRRAIQRVTGRRVKLHFQLAAETTLPFSSATPSLQFAT